MQLGTSFVKFVNSPINTFNLSSYVISALKIWAVDSEHHLPLLPQPPGSQSVPREALNYSSARTAATKMQTEQPDCSQVGNFTSEGKYEQWNPNHSKAQIHVFFHMLSDFGPRLWWSVLTEVGRAESEPVWPSSAHLGGWGGSAPEIGHALGKVR